MDSKMMSAETRYRNTWFGARARVIIGPGPLHRSGIGSWLIPHPALVNALLRAGLPEKAKRRFTFRHEFAHFTTAPFAAMYLLISSVRLWSQGQTGWFPLLVLVLSAHAAWELVSEGVVICSDRSGYGAAYSGLSRMPRILFWLAGTLLIGFGWASVWYL